MHSIQRESLYQRFGFEIMPDGVAMQICNPGKKDKKGASVFSDKCPCCVCSYLFSFFLRAAEVIMSTQVSSPR